MVEENVRRTRVGLDSRYETMVEENVRRMQAALPVVPVWIAARRRERRSKKDLSMLPSDLSPRHGCGADDKQA